MRPGTCASVRPAAHPSFSRGPRPLVRAAEHQGEHRCAPAGVTEHSSRALRIWGRTCRRVKSWRNFCHKFSLQQDFPVNTLQQRGNADWPQSQLKETGAAVEAAGFTVISKANGKPAGQPSSQIIDLTRSKTPGKEHGWQPQPLYLLRCRSARRVLPFLFCMLSTKRSVF